jgi:CRP/FNR family transcriptional regulator, cyclic AMP receptor protein
MKNSRKPGVALRAKRWSFEVGRNSPRSSDQFVQALDPLKTVVNFPKHSMLFEEGRNPDGIYYLIRGKVKLSIDLRGGRTLILGIMQPGEVLGLSAVVSGTPAAVSAETLTPAQVYFVERGEFLRLIRERSELCVQVVEVLSRQLREAVDMIHYSSGSQPAAEKLACLLVSWIDANGGDSEQGIEIKLPLTQEEIGQMIGVSRETVSRLFAGFERTEILSLDGSRLRILKRQSLEALTVPKASLESRQLPVRVEISRMEDSPVIPAREPGAESLIKRPKLL